MKFKNLDEGIDYIIGSLTQSEKDMIKNADPAGVHMALARWADSEYISNDISNIKDLVVEKLQTEESEYIHNDNIVGVLIEEIIEKLKAE